MLKCALSLNTEGEVTSWIPLQSCEFENQKSRQHGYRKKRNTHTPCCHYDGAQSFSAVCLSERGCRLCYGDIQQTYRNTQRSETDVSNEMQCELGSDLPRSAMKSQRSRYELQSFYTSIFLLYDNKLPSNNI